MVIEGVLIGVVVGFSLLLQLGFLLFELVEFGGVFFGQWNGRGGDAAELAEGLVIGLRLDLDPFPTIGAGGGRQRLQLFIDQAVEQFGIGHGSAVFAFGKEIAGHEASGRFIAVESDEADAFVGGGDFFLEEDAANHTGVIAIPLAQLVPDAFLGGVVGGEREGLQDFEGHLFGFVGGPESGTETGESQAAVDDGFADSEADGLCGVLVYVVFSADALVKTRRRTSKDHISRTLLDRPQELHQPFR